MNALVKPPTVQQPIERLLAAALDAGCSVRWDSAQVRIRGPRSQSELLRQLAGRKDQLAPLFQPGLGDVAWIGIARYPYSVWSGQQLGPCLAADTETELIRPGCIPKLALASASDGETHVLVHPDDLAKIIQQHADSIFAFHNVGFDFWVIHQHLQTDPAASSIWWQMADAGQLRDTGLLHGLYQLAKRDTYPKPESLDKLARYYVGLKLDKNGPDAVRSNHRCRLADHPARLFRLRDQGRVRYLRSLC